MSDRNVRPNVKPTSNAQTGSESVSTTYCQGEECATLAMWGQRDGDSQANIAQLIESLRLMRGRRDSKTSRQLRLSCWTAVC